MPNTPEMEEALSAPSMLLVGLVEIILPEYNLRMCDGSGKVTWDSKVFLNPDPTYGTLSTIDEISDGSADDAPAVSISIIPPTNTAAANIANPTFQGSKVSIWMAAIDLEGVVIPDPKLLFVGDLDVPRLEVDRLTRNMRLDAISVFEKFFEIDEGIRLVDSMHQYFWPGEKGLEYVTLVERQLPWGSDQPRPNLIQDTQAQNQYNFNFNVF